MDWSWLGEAFKILFGAVIGIAGKVIYDRRFAKRPDLRYTFGTPANFGTGDRERVYQNLEVTNAGTETTTDVRINFSLPNFDLSEYQIAYDGPHNIEKRNDQVGVLIPSLPPGDSVTLSFIFSPSKSSIAKIQDLFLSAKSKECVAKPLERARSTGFDSLTLAASIVTLGITFASVFFYMSWRIQSSEQMAALARFGHTKPLFLGINNDLGTENKLLRGMTISGANLGREPGKGRIVFTRRNDKTGKSVKSEPMEIDALSIKSWKADRIEFAFSNSMQERFNSVLEDLYRRLPDGDFIPSDHSYGAEIQIITISGEAVSTSAWPY